MATDGERRRRLRRERTAASRALPRLRRETAAEIRPLPADARARAWTVIRTELGRAYSVAGQERMAQAAESLPWMESWEVRDPGRRAFTDEEIARDRRRADLEPAPPPSAPAPADDPLAIPDFLKRDPAPGGVRAGLAEDSVTAAEFRKTPGYKSIDELAGVAERYYEEYYDEINEALRAGRKVADPQNARTVLDMARSSRPLREDMTLWRGRTEVLAHAVGDEIVDKGFISSSASWRTAQGFADDTYSGGGTLFQIRARKGTSAVIENEIEQEVTFMPGQRFRVAEIVDDARNGAHRGYAGPDRVYILETIED